MFNTFLDYQNQDNFAVSQEPRHHECIADKLGWDYIVVDLNKLDLAHKMAQIEKLHTNGVTHNGKTYFLTDASSSAKSGRFYLTTSPEVTLGIYPKHEDAIRVGAFFTPCYEGIKQVDFSLTVLPRAQAQAEGIRVGDGQAAISAEFALRTGLKTGDQCRWSINGKLGCVRIMPGMIPDVLISAEDMKGAIQLVHGETYAVTNEWIGVVTGAKKIDAKIPQQVTKFWSQNVWDKVTEAAPRMIRNMHIIAQNPALLADKLGKSEIRGNDGKLNYPGLLASAAKFDAELGEIALMRQGFFVETAIDLQARENQAAVISAGARGTGLRLIEEYDLADGVVLVNPRDAVGGEHVVFRVPHDLPSAAIPVFVGTSETVPHGCIYANIRTLAESGADMDGDNVVVVNCNTPWLKAWRDDLTAIKRGTDNKRAPKRPVQSRLEMIKIIASVNIGTFANAIDHLQTRILKNEKRIRTLNNPAQVARLNEWSAKCRALMEIVAEELHCAVDAAKRASIPNEEVANDAVKLAKLDKGDRVPAEISNGRLKAWRKEEKSLILPWDHAKDSTPIGEMIVKFGPQMPLVDPNERDNGNYYEWIPQIKGEGYDHAIRAYNRAIEVLSMVHNIENAEVAAEVRGQMLAKWSAWWNEKRQTKSEQWQRQAVSALWQTVMSKGGKGSKGTLMWTALPEMVFVMLNERIKAIRQESPVQRGHIVGSELEEVISKSGTVVISELKEENGRRSVVINGRRFMLAESTGKIKLPQPIRVVIKRESKGRWFFQSEIRPAL
jgi:hypothetical protein